MSRPVKVTPRGSSTYTSISNHSSNKGILLPNILIITAIDSAFWRRYLEDAET